MSAPSPAAADSFDLRAQGPGRFAATGALTFATARGARAVGRQCLAEAAERELEIDCAGVTAADSAGLAVLLDWLAGARQLGRSLRYAQLPHGLSALAQISEVEELLTRGA
jgi:phospholipid transport system transporter-binding protein